MSKLLWLLLVTWLGTASVVDSGALVDWEFYQEGVIHWYDYPGEERKMANGELFDPTKPIFAHPHLPLGTVVLVVTEHGAWVGEIQDRGPYCPREGAEGSDGLSLGEIDLEGDCEVVLDVSPMVAGELLGEFGYNDRGVAYGEAWGRIYCPEELKGRKIVPFQGPHSRKGMFATLSLMTGDHHRYLLSDLARPQSPCLIQPKRLRRMRIGTPLEESSSVPTDLVPGDENHLPCHVPIPLLDLAQQLFPTPLGLE